MASPHGLFQALGLKIMRVITAGISVLLAATTAVAAQPSAKDTLTAIGAQLRKFRALPVGAKTHASCPDHLEQFKGIPKNIIESKLGSADILAGSENTYFMNSPVPLGQKGGGFPELTFSFGSSNRVLSVKCSYSR